MGMKLRNGLIASAVAAALGSAGSAVVFAQNAGDQSAGQTQRPIQLEEVVVTGIRASLQSAQALKRNSDTVQDSIVAEDIGKLPDVTATEAMQRITGIQIGRDLGEGGGTVTIGGSAVNSGIEIRGLPQVETTLNGREVFTATGSRVLNFEDIPSTLLAGIDVYKAPTANLVEGGIGGTIDLRTRKPFDFKGLELETSAAARYGDLSRRATSEFTALASDRWATGIGEIGALLSIGYQDRAYREYASGQNAPAPYPTASAPQFFVPTGTFNGLVNGDRRRTGVDGVLQWQAASDLQLYAEVSSQELRSQQDQFYLQSQADAAHGATLVPGSATLFPGTQDANFASYTNVPISPYNSFRGVTDVSREYALNGKWTPGRLTLTGDFSYTRATEVLTNPTMAPTALAPVYSQTLSLGGIPQTQVSGVDLTNIASYNFPLAAKYFDSVFYLNQNFYDGNEKAAKLDVDYSLGGGFLTSLSAGIRYGDRLLGFQAVRDFNYGITGAHWQALAAAHPGLFGLMPFGQYFSPTESVAIQPSVLAADIRALQYNYASLRQELGITNPLGLAPTQAYNAEEKNYAAWFRANFEANIGIPMDGNIGVRVPKRDLFLRGFIPTYTGTTLTGYQAIKYSNSATDPLPSLNLRFKLTDSLQARLAASKVITYPDFSQLAPSFNLLQAQQSATGGNPYLKPTRANQADGTLEWYFAPASSVYGALFYKKVTDFVFQNVVGGINIGGTIYNVTGPKNGGDGTIKGVEFGYQQFLDFLPGWWSGIGFQANYTHVDAVAPTAAAGVTTTLPGLSKNSFNLVGIYEKGPVSFRLAYNWRSQFYQSIYTGATAALSANPIFYQQYGWLDGSLTYDVTGQWSVYAQGSNLLRTRLHTFYGVETRPNAYLIDDRQALLGFRFKF